MPQFETKRRVAHSADDMFDLVADVEKYPRFLPLCQALMVRGRKQLGDGREVLVADMTVAYRFVKETFTSRVVLDRGTRTIEVSYLDGPFKTMEIRWTFVPIDGTRSEVGFYVHYEFRNRTFSTLMGAVFDRAVRRFTNAFEDRADEVYGAA
jgi:coenzyme Q-binding protein COQ10